MPAEPMPLPAPLIVHVVPDSDWLPTARGSPTSPQFQPDGHAVAGAVSCGVFDIAPTAKLSNVASPELAARPAMEAYGISTVAVLPGTEVNVTPSGEVAAVSTSPCRWISRYRLLTGTVFAAVVAPPKLFRYWTVTPADVTNIP